MDHHRESWGDMQNVLSVMIVGSFITVIFIWMFFPPKGDAGSIAVLNTLVGTLGTMVGMIAAYQWGSNKSSKLKDNTIATMATGTGSGNGASAAAVTAAAAAAAVPAAVLAAAPAAAAAAPIAAAMVAPQAAADAAPPAAEDAAPQAARKAVADYIHGAGDANGEARPADAPKKD